MSEKEKQEQLSYRKPCLYIFRGCGEASDQALSQVTKLDCMSPIFPHHYPMVHPGPINFAQLDSCPQKGGERDRPKPGFLIKKIKQCPPTFCSTIEA